MDELEGTEQLGRDGDLAPVLVATLQGPGPDRHRLEIDVEGADGQGLGNPCSGVDEREGEGLSWCHGARRAASRKRRRASVAMYLRSRASTSWRSRTRRDISKKVKPANLKRRLSPW